MNLKIQNKIDLEIVNRAEQELYQILLQQRFSFNDRWYANRSVNKVIKALRLFGLIVSVLGFVLCVFLYSLNPNWSSYSLDGVSYIIIFMVFALIFYYLPSLENSIKKFTKNTSKRSCEKLAAKCVKKARKLAPFNAEYEIKGDLITYYRGNSKDKDDVWELAWFRRLKGVAIHGEFATAIFKKSTSFQPSIIILHENFTPLENVFNTLNLEYKKQ